MGKNYHNMIVRTSSGNKYRIEHSRGSWYNLNWDPSLGHIDKGSAQYTENEIESYLNTSWKVIKEPDGNIDNYQIF